jgi:hypothetical protein
MNYREWNTALGKWFFKPERAGRLVHLAVDAEELLLAAAADGHSFSSAAEARADFVRAVCTELRHRDWPDSGELWEGYPRCIGLLALQVLAVTDMAEDEKWTSKAYWPRLQELLGRTDEPPGKPLNLSYETHANLWRRHLANWANSRMKGSLGELYLPDFTEGHKYVRLPISHALLRRADLDRLADLFKESGFHPYESDVALSRIKGLLSNNRSETRFFGPHARRVLSDSDRLEAASRQVASVLAEWDGTSETRTRQAKKRPEVRLWADVVGRKPDRFVGGLIYRTHAGARKTDWRRCQKINIRKTWKNARRKSSTEWTEGGVTLRYRPIHPERFVLVHDSTTNYFIERRRGAPGDRLLILCSRESTWQLLDAIEEISEHHVVFGSFPNAETLQDLPQEWILIQLQVSRKLPPDIPEPWSGIIEPRLSSLQMLEGLRLVPHRPVWMAGAGPRILVEGGSSKNLLVKRDDQITRVPLEEDLTPQGTFDSQGFYEVWLPEESWRTQVFEVRVPRRVRPTDASHGWLLRQGTWPAAASQSGQEECQFLCGMVACGVLPEVDEPEEGETRQFPLFPEARLFLELSLRHQSHAPSLPGLADPYLKAGKNHSNPLIRHLARLIEMGHRLDKGGKAR